MIARDNDYITIPSDSLYINSYYNFGSVGFYYYAYNAHGWYSYGNNNYSIRCVERIRAKEFNATSSKRIKNI